MFQTISSEAFAIWTALTKAAADSVIGCLFDMLPIVGAFDTVRPIGHNRHNGSLGRNKTEPNSGHENQMGTTIS